MKKGFALLLILMIAVVCCACGEKNDSKKEEPTESHPVTYVLAPDVESNQKVKPEELKAVKEVLDTRLKVAGVEYSVESENGEFTVTLPDNLGTDLLTRKGVVAFVGPNGNPAIVNSDIKSSSVEYDKNKKEHFAKLVFTDEGKKKFEELTKSSIGKATEVFIDSEVICAPTVYAPITNGEVEIHGDFTEEKAITVASLMIGETLPFPLKIVSQ